MAVPSPPTRPALRARYEARRREVVATAARLFAERGYAATSISELTEATGLAAGGLYHYIEGKDDLLIAICDELLEPLLARAREIVATEAPPLEQLRALVTAWVGHVVEHRHHMLVFTQERQAIEHERRWRRVRSQRKAFEKMLEEVFSRGEADGSMTFADRRLALLALLGMVNYTPQWVRPNGRLSPMEIAEGYCAMVLGK
ncbi:MAG TPA: TetR/AcrR family transcriptional regulator [Solirubrobacterales bacterium]|jgi:AcrR family transcriptional regulator|nr:TetR/AcrR family transcriptional regulator [Solirubrobacterales bacterium]